MSTKRKRHIRYLVITLVPVFLIGLVVLPAVFSNQGEGAPPQPQGAALANSRSCAECHNDTTLITGRKTEWAESLHGTGEAYVRGTSASCAGCHSGGGFSLMAAAGQAPNQVTSGDPHPTRQDCRACHQIHNSYTVDDWALETTAPVSLFASPGVTFDGGEGNLCADCHQARRIWPGDPDGDGTVTGISTHWGPHHGPQSAMMLGIAGAGAQGTPAGHYSAVGDTCVGCHMGPNGTHTYEPNVGVCQGCHAGATNFDINGVQSQTLARLDELGALLVAEGVLSSNDEDGHPTVSSAPENVASALWNWLYIRHEDESLGVHNPAYTDALLDASFAALGQYGP